MRALTTMRIIPLLMAAVLAGCAERSTGVATAEPTRPAPTGAQSFLTVTCSATIATRTVSCGNPATNDEVFSDVVVGGQNTNVILTSGLATTAPGSDCPNAQVPDGTKSCFSFDVTVKNLIPQPMGTADTTATHAPHANGVRVFFQSGPTVTGGSGAVILANPTGTGNFTGSNQAFFQNNEVLVQNATSAVKNWQFQYSPAVTAFHFTVYVSTAVPYPDGYVDGLARVITLTHSGAFTLQGTSRNFVGNGDGATIVWTSANPALASISGSTVNSASTDGATTVTAQSGLRPGTQTTWVAVCNISTVANGVNLAASISGGDCFAAFEPFSTYLPSTSYRGDLYFVTVALGQTVTVTLDTTAGNLDTYLILADRLGNVLAQNDDGGPSLLGSQVIFVNNIATGVAVIQALPRNSGVTGTYQLTVTITP